MAEEINFEVTGFGQLREQLREAQLEMIKLAEAGKSGSAEFAAAARKAGELKEAISDASDAATVFQDGGKFKAAAQGLGMISSGFGAITGAVTIAGGDVKEFQKTMLQLQSAIAITNLFESFSEIGDVFKKLKLAAIDTFTTLKAQIGSTGIGLLVIGIGVAIQQLITYMNELTAAEKANKLQSEVLERQLKDLTTTYDDLSDSIAYNTEVEIARAQAAGKSEVEVQDIRIKGIKAAQKALEDAHIKERNIFEDRFAANNKLDQTVEEHGANYQKINDERTAADNKYNDNAKKLQKDLDVAEANRVALVKNSNKKIATDNKETAAKEKQRQLKALEEKKTLDQAKLESEKLVKIGQAKTEEEKLQLEQIYVEKALAIDSTYQMNRAKIAGDSAAALQAKLIENDNKSLAQQQKTAEALTALAQKNADEKKQKDDKDAADAKQKAQEDLDKELQKIEDKKNLRDIASEKTLQDQFDLDNALYESESKALEDKLALYEEGSSEYIAIVKQIADREVDIEKKKQDAKKALQQLAIDTATGLLDDLKSLNQNYDKDNEEQAKKAFEREKAYSIASTLIATYVAAQKAYASQLIIGDPTSIVRAQIAAGLAIVGGLARVAVISQQQFQPSGSKSSSSKKEDNAQASRYEEGGLLGGRSHDLGGIRTSMGELEGGEFVINRRATANFLPLLESINSIGNTKGPEVPETQQPIFKTYVVASEMTSQQEANAKLSALARI